MLLQLNRQAIFGARDSDNKLVKFLVGGGGYAGGGKENHYWVFDTAFSGVCHAQVPMCAYVFACACFVCFLHRAHQF